MLAKATKRLLAHHGETSIGNRLAGLRQLHGFQDPWVMLTPQCSPLPTRSFCLNLPRNVAKKNLPI